MTLGILAPVVLGQAGTPPLAKLESFLQSHPTLVAEFQLMEPGRAPTKATFFKNGEKEWMLSFQGIQFSSSLTRIGEALTEVDHLTKRYETFDEFTGGRSGAALGPFIPPMLLLEDVRRWKPLKPSASTAESFTFTERSYSISVKLNPDGSPATMTSKITVQGEATTLEYRFTKYTLGGKSRISLVPPAGYEPWVQELRWPTPVGEQLPDVLGRGPLSTSWKTISGGSRVLLAFIQESDPLSQALVTDLEKQRGEIEGSKTLLRLVYVGKPKNMDKEPLWLEPDGRACRALGLPGTPVLTLVKPDRSIVWAWQGYAAKQRGRAMASLKAALAPKQ